jgi:uncharacterized protein YkwD/Tfp pilus assembly protein PilF
MFHNKYAAADAQLQALIKSRPKDAQPHAAYALLLNYQNKQKQALAEAREAKKLDPKDGYVLTILTRVEDWNFDLQSAEADGALAIKAVPNSALARAFYGEVLADVGKYPEAKAQLEKGAQLAQRGPAYDKGEVERNWANYFRDQKDYTQALVHLKLAAGAQPGWVERLLELARFSLARQDLPAATSYLQRAADLSPDDANLREQLGDIAIFAQDYGLAKKAYTAALKLQPRSVLDLKMLGDIAVALDHDPATAVKQERAALAIEPSDQEAGAYLVAVLRYLMSDEAAALEAAKHSVSPKASPEAATPSVDLDKLAADRQAAALATVNSYRKIAGLPPVVGNATISRSALAHSFYTFFNGARSDIRDLGIHREAKDAQGYIGDNVLTRAQHFGYPTRPMTEIITHRADAGAAVSDWIDSVYHRIPLLRRDLLELGYGDAYLGPLTVQVMDMAYTDSAGGKVVLYPTANQSDVPISFNGNEVPDPAPNAEYPIGYPVTATFPRNATVSISGFHFRDSSGLDLPGYQLPPSNETENSFAFLANSPLKPGTTYTAELSGSVNGAAFRELWRFTTRAAPAQPGVQQAVRRPMIA